MDNRGTRTKKCQKPWSTHKWGKLCSLHRRSSRCRSAWLDFQTERIDLFQNEIRSNNFSKFSPSPKTDSFQIHILLKSKILLPFCLAYTQWHRSTVCRPWP